MPVLAYKQNSLDWVFTNRVGDETVVISVLIETESYKRKSKKASWENQ